MALVWTATTGWTTARLMLRVLHLAALAGLHDFSRTQAKDSLAIRYGLNIPGHDDWVTVADGLNVSVKWPAAEDQTVVANVGAIEKYNAPANSQYALEVIRRPVN